MRRIVSTVEIGLGLVLIAATASLLVYDWFDALFCDPNHFECASWAFMLLGLYIGIPTLLVGLVVRRFPGGFWLVQCFLIVFFLWNVYQAARPI